jgi:hypothetical protein
MDAMRDVIDRDDTGPFKEKARFARVAEPSDGVANCALY